MGELLGDSRDIVAQSALPLHRHRRPDLREVPTVGPEVHAGRARAARRSAARASPALRASSCARRRSRPRTPSPARSRSQSRHTIRFAFSARSTAAPASGPSGTTSIPIASRTSANHANSSGGSTGSTTTVGATPRPASHAAAKSKPPRCGSARMSPLPAASAASMCSQPIASKRGSTDCRGVRGQPEELEPVPPVRGERVRHRALQLATLEPARGRASEVAGDESTPPGEERREGAPARPRRSASRRAPGSAFASAAAPRYAQVRRAIGDCGPVGRGGGQGRLRRAARAWRRASRRASGPRCSRQRASIGTRSVGAPRRTAHPAVTGLEQAWAAPGRSEAWRHTLMNRCTAVSDVRTIITQSTGTRMLKKSPMPSRHHPLGALHEPTLGVVAEPLGPGPLVGHEHRERGRGEREDRVVRALDRRGTRRRHRARRRRRRGR